MNLKDIQLKLQDIACNQNYSTKQDRYLSIDSQRIVNNSLNGLEKIILYFTDFVELEIPEIRDLLFQDIPKNFDKYQEINDLVDILDELEMTLIQINIIQETDPKFVYKETIEPFNQV